VGQCDRRVDREGIFPGLDRKLIILRAFLIRRIEKEVALGKRGQPLPDPCPRGWERRFPRIARLTVSINWISSWAKTSTPGTHKKMNEKDEQELREFVRLKHHSHGLKTQQLG